MTFHLPAPAVVGCFGGEGELGGMPLAEAWGVGGANENSVVRLAGAVLLDIYDEWAVAERRYLSAGSLAKLCETRQDNNRQGGGKSAQRTRGLITTTFAEDHNDALIPTTQRARPAGCGSAADIEVQK